MAVPILCLVALLFLCWVIVLKAEMSDRDEEIRDLKSRLETRRQTTEFSVSRKLMNFVEEDETTS